MLTLSPEAATQSLTILRQQRIHGHFAGYLCLKRTAGLENRTTNLTPDFKEFFDTFLTAQDAPPRKPYIYPFSDTPPSDANKWFNENVAGSYTPSSLRPDSPFTKVCLVQGRGRQTRYSLRDRHWELARQHLLFGAQIPVMSLVTVLYRDFGFTLPTRDVSHLIEVFKHEFGYQRAPSAGSEFAHIFVSPPTDNPHADWLIESP